MDVLHVCAWYVLGVSMQMHIRVCECPCGGHVCVLSDLRQCYLMQGPPSFCGHDCGLI